MGDDARRRRRPPAHGDDRPGDAPPAPLTAVARPSLSVSTALAVAPAVVWALVAAAGVWWPAGFYYFVAEDHVFEWIQVGAYAVAAAGFGTLAYFLRGPSGRWTVLAALAAAFFVVVVGEEVAWGQRVFGVSVPALERVNDQGDVSLHNVGAGLTLSQLGLLGIAMAGLAARPAAGWLARRRRFVVRDEYLPPGFLAPWFGLAAAFTLVRLVLPTTPARVAKFSEVAELTVALAAAITSIKLARTASADRSTVSPPFQDQAPHAQ